MEAPIAHGDAPQRPPAPNRIALCLSPHMSLSSALTAIEPLRSVNRFFRCPAYEISLVGPSTEPVVSGIGIAVMPASTFEDDAAFDMVVTVSAYDQAEDYKRPLQRFLRRHARRGALPCGIDFGVVFLARGGTPRRSRATMHWEVLQSVVDRFPDVAVCDDVYVIDRQRLSCGGHLAGHDLFLALVERDHGAKVARFVAADLLHGAVRPADTRQANPLSWDPTIRDRRLRRVSELMEATVEEPLAVPALAEAVGLSLRQLQALAREHFGETLSARYLAIRLNAARHMLMYADMSITEIVAATGFSSAATFARAFRRQFNTTATLYRKAFTSRMARPYLEAGPRGGRMSHQQIFVQ
ncbi:GlxA family transcriptional regulator [Acuticoccus sp.]|uniref:GlxA family transcriptional regulator n=1 Tax=Acuticoccus sp. TaxID=1904378 RepID=UPI003B5244E0